MGVGDKGLIEKKKKQAVSRVGKGTTGHDAGSRLKHYLGGGGVSACLTEW